MSHDNTYVAFVPGEMRALTIEYVEELLERLPRRDVMAGGMMCCEGHRVVPVRCKTRHSHFRHFNPPSCGGSAPSVTACPCSKSKVHLEAQRLLNDHDYRDPVCFVQWYRCGIHFSTVFTATSDVYPVLEVTERSRDGRKGFRTDVAYRRREDDEICQRVEIWHRHRTGIDGARRDVEFLEADATHVKQKMLDKDFTIRVEMVHVKECPTCAENERLAEEERHARILEELQREAMEREERLAEERRAEEERQIRVCVELRREAMEREERLIKERFAEEERKREAEERKERLAAEQLAEEKRRAFIEERQRQERMKREQTFQAFFAGTMKDNTKSQRNKEDICKHERQTLKHLRSVFRRKTRV